MDPTTSSSEAIVLVARLSLSLFLLRPVFGKLANYRQFVQGVIEYQILPERAARTVGFILPWVELVLALILIAGIALPIAGFATALLLLCFTAAVLANLHRGREIKCHCYGIADPSTISWGTAVRNLLLLLLALLIVGCSSQTIASSGKSTLLLQNRLILSPGISSALLLLLVICCCVSLLLLGWAVDVYWRVSKLRHM